MVKASKCSLCFLQAWYSRGILLQSPHSKHSSLSIHLRHFKLSFIPQCKEALTPSSSTKQTITCKALSISKVFREGHQTRASFSLQGIKPLNYKTLGRILSTSSQTLSFTFNNSKCLRWSRSSTKRKSKWIYSRSPLSYQKRKLPKSYTSKPTLKVKCRLKWANLTLKKLREKLRSRRLLNTKLRILRQVSLEASLRNLRINLRMMST